jgi:hypothetical protein
LILIIHSFCALISLDSTRAKGMADGFPAHLLDLSTLLVVSRSTSFTHCHSSALRTLSHLFQRYLETLATASTQRANLAGRDSVTVWDLGRAIDEFQGGFKGFEQEFNSADLGVEEEALALRDLAKNLQGMPSSPILSSWRPNPPPCPCE